MGMATSFSLLMEFLDWKWTHLSLTYRTRLWHLQQVPLLLCSIRVTCSIFVKLKHYILTPMLSALMRTLMYVLNAKKDCWTYDDTNEVVQRKEAVGRKSFGFQRNWKCSPLQLNEINNFIYEFYNRYWKRIKRHISWHINDDDDDDDNELLILKTEHQFNTSV